MSKIVDTLTTIVIFWLIFCMFFNVVMFFVSLNNNAKKRKLVGYGVAEYYLDENYDEKWRMKDGKKDPFENTWPKGIDSWFFD